MKFKVSNDSINLASRAYRLGLKHASSILEGKVFLDDYDDYGGHVRWQGNNGWVYTDMTGSVIEIDVD